MGRLRYGRRLDISASTLTLQLLFLFLAGIGRSSSTKEVTIDIGVWFPFLFCEFAHCITSYPPSLRSIVGLMKLRQEFSARFRSHSDQLISATMTFRGTGTTESAGTRFNAI